jgi:hypothetical protein
MANAAPTPLPPTGGGMPIAGQQIKLESDKASWLKLAAQGRGMAEEADPESQEPKQ